MVPDLIYYSHPGKPLEKHIFGVLEKSRKYSSLKICELACLFHDLGKINPNFQKKILNQPVNGYGNHSYLSLYALLSYVKNNQAKIKSDIDANDIKNLKLKLLQVIAIITHHHGNIPDFESLTNADEVYKASEFIKLNALPISEFIMEKLKHLHTPFTLNLSEIEFKSLTRFTSELRNQWQIDSLPYFMDTQFAFAALIEADKRDAGNNDKYNLKESVSDSCCIISERLNRKFGELEANLNRNELNNLRTEIRKEAVSSIKKELEQDKRIFTITAPTGAGKTYTLLAVANEIQKTRGDMGVVYALPFLSITEQVQNILNELGIDFLAVNSKATNSKLEDAKKAYDQNANQENLKILINEDYAENTFDHPFIITTFVQFFETLVSNNNATLLKLPNFSNRIFLIDEFQALPPRLYIFFSAWLQVFCLKHNSYAVLSTATMPKLDFPIKITVPDNRKPEVLFKNYLPDLPRELITPKKYFGANIFNRYKIHLIDDDSFTIEKLASHVRAQANSCLVILNTISDTKALYKELVNDNKTILLNTHFIPIDRINKIKIAQDFLKGSEKVILISTQLIEAGVDIDFPVVYRDLCPLPSLIQSAGRCNRNKKNNCGDVYLFQLINENGKAGSEMIYRKEASEFLRFCKREIKSGIQENELFSVQSKFFDFIKENLSIGDFEFANDQKANMIECVNNAEFERLGKFQLISDYSFGEQYRYYIPADEFDTTYFDLIEKTNQFGAKNSFEQNKAFQITVNEGLKKLSQRIINVRIRKNQTPPAYSNPDEKFGIRVLSDISKYSLEKGLELGIENQIL